jgi:hypothetical protein
VDADNGYGRERVGNSYRFSQIGPLHDRKTSTHRHFAESVADQPQGNLWGSARKTKTQKQFQESAGALPAGRPVESQVPEAELAALQPDAIGGTEPTMGHLPPPDSLREESPASAGFLTPGRARPRRSEFRQLAGPPLLTPVKARESADSTDLRPPRNHVPVIDASEARFHRYCYEPFDQKVISQMEAVRAAATRLRQPSPSEDVKLGEHRFNCLHSRNDLLVTADLERHDVSRSLKRRSQRDDLLPRKNLWNLRILFPSALDPSV